MEANFIEMTGDSVEDAISKGLEALGVSPAQVMIEVLDEPSTGMFGNASTQARVRLQLLGGRPSMPPPMVNDYPVDEAITFPPTGSAPPMDMDSEAPRSAPRRSQERSDRERRPAASADGASKDTSRRDGSPRRERTSQGQDGASASAQPRSATGGERPERPRPERRSDGDERPIHERTAEKKPYFDHDIDDKDEELPLLYQAEEVPESEQDEEAQVSKVVLNELLERMGVRARVFVRRANQGEDGGKSPWVLDVGAGRNASRLVGRRGETLAALQYVTRLIASRELQTRVDIVVDIESHKVKRAENLHGLAIRMADEAVARQQTMTLEPMPPHERRVIHIALRGRGDVTTRSIGEGNSRKVTIVPQPAAS